MDSNKDDKNYKFPNGMTIKECEDIMHKDCRKAGEDLTHLTSYLIDVLVAFNREF